VEREERYCEIAVMRLQQEYLTLSTYTKTEAEEHRETAFLPLGDTLRTAQPSSPDREHAQERQNTAPGFCDAHD
jgi:hypothetical protein